MDVRIDEKGKYFTARIAKDALHALIRTTDQYIVGYIHIRPDRRLKDEMDADASRFLPITDAKVYSVADNSLLYMTGFILIAYTQITSITPVEAISEAHTGPWSVVDMEERPA